MERIDLSRAEEPRDIVHRAVARVAGGGVIALPTGSFYCLAAGAVNDEFLDRLRSRGVPPYLASVSVKAMEELADWVPNPSAAALKFARRCWPGPVALRFPKDATRGGLADRLSPKIQTALANERGAIDFRCPAHPFFRELSRLVSGPLILVEPRSFQDPTPTTGEWFEQSPWLSAVDMCIQDGPYATTGPCTIVAIDGDEWAVERPGVVSVEQIRRMAGTILLFVCTGNTCRSPMAEAICKKRLAERLRCSAAELEERGYVVLSGGLSAAYGHPAAREAMEAVQAMGASLRDHGSRPVTRDLIAQADLILAMTNDHRHILLSQIPEAAGRVRLLNPKGHDIPDPIGMDRDTYRRTAQNIDTHILELLDDMKIS